MDALIWTIALISISVPIGLLAYLNRRSNERLLELAQEVEKVRERNAALQARILEAEKVLEAQRAFAEDIKKLLEQMKGLEERIDGPAIPDLFTRMTERTATLVLNRLPDDANRRLMALAASLGGLMTAHGFIALAINNHMLKIKKMGGLGDADVYHMRPLADEDANADDLDGEDEEPPPSGDLN